MERRKFTREFKLGSVLAAKHIHADDTTVPVVANALSRRSPPREARERLRLAVRDTTKNPELAKSHKPGQAWEWPKGSLALKDVRTALTT